MGLLAGDKATGDDFANLEVKTHDPLDSGTTTSTTFTTTRSGATSPVGTAFIVPPSGKVKVHWACGITNSANTNYGLVGFQIKTGSTVGSGSTLFGASDSRAVQHTPQTAGSAEQQAGRTSTVPGLTPGDTCNVSLVYRVLGGTGTFQRVEVTLDPCIA